MRKEFKFLVIGLTFLFCAKANAQNNYIGVRGGISIPNLTAGGSEKNPLNTGYGSRLGPDFGVFAEFAISKVFSLQPMIEYSAEGGKKSGLQAFPLPDEYAGYFPSGMAPTYLYADFKSEAKINYLLLPVLAKFGWNFRAQSPWRVYIDAGPFIGFLLSAKQVTSGSSNVYFDAEGKQPLTPGPQSFDATKDIKDQLNTTNFGVEANVGLSYSLGAGKFLIEGGGNYGFINIQKGTANGKNNAGAATVTLGYAYSLGK